MKFFQMMKKNFLLIFRNRISAFSVLFGPLVLIVLIGLAFSTPSTYDLSVGIKKMSDESLTQRFVDNMKKDGFSVMEFDSLDECIKAVERGTLQTCILFPDDFELADNKTNELIFYVDESRTNFVYQIIETISANIGVESSQISADLTEDILELLWRTEEGLDDAIATIILMRANTQNSAGDTQRTLGLVEDIELETRSLSTSDVMSSFEATVRLHRDIRDETKDIITSAQSFLTALEQEPYAGELDIAALKTKLSALNSFVDKTRTDVDEEVDFFSDALDDVKDSFDSYSAQLNTVADLREDIIVELQTLQDRIDTLRNDLSTLKEGLEALQANINNLKITSSETISRPIITTIEPVHVSENKLFYLFPYLINLVILFVGLLLPATLIVIEKKSKSSFRTFCTPTKDGLFMFAQFLTSIAIVGVQLIVVLGIAYYFLGEALLNNIWVSSFLLLLSIILFVLLGMGIGYMFTNQEGVTIASISLSSLFLFLSNLVLPIETLGQQIQDISAFNPYMIASESLRKSMLFSASIVELQKEIAILASLSAIILVLIVIIKDIVKSRYQLHLAFMRNKNRVQKPSDTYLHILEELVKSPQELLEWLEKSDDESFKSFNRKDVSTWLRKQHHISLLLHRKSREQIIEMLKKRLK